MLKEVFYDLCKKYSSDLEIISTFWNEINTNYSSSQRFYHTLSHLETMYKELEKVKTEINDWDTILFSLFYHDLIYDVQKSDNEEQSAIIAKSRLNTLNVPKKKIDACFKQIMATKLHEDRLDCDCEFFIDSDLVILGSIDEEYKMYYINIRKEYAFYSDEAYVHGRLAVLRHFYEMKSIYKTKCFQSKFEEKAKANLLAEINFLKEVFYL